MAYLEELVAKLSWNRRLSAAEAQTRIEVEVEHIAVRVERIEQVVVGRIEAKVARNAVFVVVDSHKAEVEIAEILAVEGFAVKVGRNAIGVDLQTVVGID
jgi:hypothetical protein